MSDDGEPLAGLSDEDARIAKVRMRHEAALLRFPNVVGVGQGVQSTGGKLVIVVYVARKVPRDQLSASDTLPSEIDGVPVDVVETGEIDALHS